MHNIDSNTYLYYESKLYDSEIQKPEKGWVVSGVRDKNQELREMEGLFNQILPKLGLNPKEESDFKSYWLSKLPQSPMFLFSLPTC